MSGKRWFLTLGVAATLALVCAAIGLLVVLPKVIEGKVLEGAREQGVTLEPEDISFGWGWVQITQTKLTFDRVRSVNAQIGRIDVTLAGLTPTAIELTNVEGQVLGSITNVALELSEWTKSHPTAYALPLSAKNMHVVFVERTGVAPFLDVSGGTLTHTASGGVFAAEQSHFLGVDLGKIGAGFAREGSNVALGFGETDLGHAPFRVEIAPALAVPTATITLAPTPVERLAKPLGVALAMSGVSVSAITTLSFPSAGSEQNVEGNTSVTLKGYVPPHPFELDGFIFGDTTELQTKFSLPPLRDRIVFSNTQLKAGAFSLAGGGLLLRSSDHSELNLDLHGKLPCSALASVEANSRVSKILGTALGTKAGQLAEKLLNGSVAIGLHVEADTRNLTAARVARTIGVGCGLHPLSVTELNQLLPLPADVNAVLAGLPALPADLSSLPALPALLSGLPPVPSGVPALPSGLPALPNLALPVLPALPTATAQPASSATKAPANNAPPKSAPSSGK